MHYKFSRYNYFIATLRSLEKIIETKKIEKKKQVRRALRGAGKPWTLHNCRENFEKRNNTREKIEVFNDNIGGIFPLILDLTSQGWSLPRIEKEMCLTNRMLWRWLETRPSLAKAVRAARGLNRSAVDYIEEDL